MIICGFVHHQKETSPDSEEAYKEKREGVKMNFWFFKTQIVCFIIYAYIAFCYSREHSKSDPARQKSFLLLYACAVANLVLDVATVYTINHVDFVGSHVNLICHFLFYASFMLYELLLFRYFCILCRVSLPKGLHIALRLPYLVGTLATFLTMSSFEVMQGSITAFSAGTPIYVVSIVIAFYFLASTFIFVAKRRYILKRNFILLLFSTGVSVLGLMIQLILKEALFSCIIIIFTILVLYQAIENGVYERSKIRQQELSHVIADIVESRDVDTGGHVKRTTAYVELIAKNLRADESYMSILNEDYIEALMLAAPMHDVGKIAIPDSILQKPGRLTQEKYEMMKYHAEKGAYLLEKSVNTENQLFKQLLCETSLYHHEKWDGRGYPQGLSGQSIPLCARIMAVADVFDAVSQDRCYRGAMSLDESFDIIEKGSGKDFDPVIAQCFLTNRSLVEGIYTRYTA